MTANEWDNGMYVLADGQSKGDDMSEQDWIALRDLLRKVRNSSGASFGEQGRNMLAALNAVDGQAEADWLMDVSARWLLPN